MKKVVSIALILALALSLFAGCGKNADSPLANATAYLEEMYQTGEKGEVMTIDKDKDVLSIVTIDGVTYPVEWSINITSGAADSVKIGTTETANCVLIDLPDVAETDILFTAVATVKDEEGNSEAANFNFKMACTLGEFEILSKAYELADGEKMSGTPSLTGDIVEIKTPWDATAKNITVVIQVGDAADKPVLCVGLQGDYADGLVVGDNICVQGVLGKNGGIVGFESGCTLVFVNKADGSIPGGETTTTTTGVATVTNADGSVVTNADGSAITTIITNAPTTANGGGNKTTANNGGGNKTTANNGGGNKTTKPTTTTLKLVTDQAKILADIAKLGENASTNYIAQLTGEVLNVDKRSDEDKQYGQVTLTFKVGGTTIECYKMKGTGADTVKAGDTITVKGVIKNYFYEGATKGKIEFAWHEASGTEVTLVKLVPCAVQDLSTPAKILAAAKKLDNGEALQEEVTLTGKVNDIETPYSSEHGNITVNMTVENTTIKCYRLTGNGVDKIQIGDTITVKGMIKNFNGIIEFDFGSTMTKRVPSTTTTKPKTIKKVDAPKAGVAYKFGMVQENVDKKAVYYLKSEMSGFYMATSSNFDAAADVYLENANGGYYLYTMVGGKKQYINMVLSKDGAHVNGAFEATAKTVYTYDTTAKTLVADMTKGGKTEPYWFGTRNDKNYTTVGPCAVSYEGFYCQFYAEA